MDVKETINIEDIIEEKYNDWLYSTNEGIGLTIEEAKHILRNDPDFHYCDSLLYEAYKVVLSELEKKDKDIQRMQELLDLSDANNVKKDKIIDLMAEQIFYWQDDKFPLGYSIKDVKEYFTKKVEGK